MTSRGIPLELEGGQGDRRRRVPADRLGDDAHAGELLSDHRTVAALGDTATSSAASPSSGCPTIRSDGALEQRLVAEEGQERLRRLRPAERPQPRPATARHDHRVHGHPACIAGNPIGAEAARGSRSVSAAREAAGGRTSRSGRGHLEARLGGERLGLVGALPRAGPGPSRPKWP